MTDLPDEIDDLTPEVARGAPAGPETDRLCNLAFNRNVVESLDRGAIGYDDRGTKCLHRALYRVSQNAAGAYAAREWLRDRGWSVDIQHEFNGGRIQARAYTSPQLEAEAYAPTEHLATARLLLTLYAEGVLT